MLKEKSLVNITNKFKIYLTNLNYDNYFRIEVITGGCSGFQYHFSFSSIEETDIILDSEYKIITDEVSKNYLIGSTIDYIDEIFNSSIKISNPKFNNTCGCGVSFS